MAEQFRLYCRGWTFKVLLLWLDSSSCTAVAGQFRLYCCGWTVQVVLLWLDSSGCTVASSVLKLPPWIKRLVPVASVEVEQVVCVNAAS